MSPKKKTHKAATPNKKAITANDIRRAAEAADGIRGEPVNIAIRRDGTLSVGKASGGMQAGAELAITCETDDVVPNRAKFKSVTPDPAVVDQKGKLITDFQGFCDALFWTEAAVEKFVLPYYMHFFGPEDIQRLWKAFNRADVYAMVHLPLSEPGLLLEPIGVISDIGQRGNPQLFSLNEYFSLALI